ncbi:MAG: type I-B CRISPR-associated endonuclease Cas1b [Candidatus Thorarchaeota archaeon]
MEPVYIKSNVMMFREGNTIYTMSRETGKRAFPIHNVSDIYCLGKVSVRSGAASLLMEKDIPVHFFNKYGAYVGSLMPKKDLISGKVVLAQAAHHLDSAKRLRVATAILEGIQLAMLKSLKYYLRRGKSVSKHIREIQLVSTEGASVAELMGLEGQMWTEYYRAYNTICVPFSMTSRSYRPPEDPLNSLISLANSMIYATVLSEIHKTYLHPAISFLHEPLERRYSLALDLADMFKPLVATPVIVRLVNQGIITQDSFNTEIGFRLKENALADFLQAYHGRMSETLPHPRLRRKVSYRYMIRLECYRLMKHFLGDRVYSALAFDEQESSDVRDHSI